MPYKPLRELKPELFVHEPNKLNVLHFDDPESDDETESEPHYTDDDTDNDLRDTNRR